MPRSSERKPSGGRRGYPSRPLGPALAMVGASRETQACLSAVVVDGVGLLDDSNTARTPKDFEIRPTGKYAEAFSAAVAGCAIRLRDIRISTRFDDGYERETPDLLLHAANQQPVDVEVTRVDATAATAVHLFEVQARIASMLRDTPGLKSDRLITFTVEYELAAAHDGEDLMRLGDELAEFLERRSSRLLPAGRYDSVFAADTVASRTGLVVEIEQPTSLSLLSFARTDPMTPYADIVAAIESKRDLAYVHENALWLVVDVADPRGPFRAAIEAVRATQIDITPFSRVVVQGYGDVAVIDMTGAP